MAFTERSTDGNTSCTKCSELQPVPLSVAPLSVPQPDTLQMIRGYGALLRLRLLCCGRVLDIAEDMQLQVDSTAWVIAGTLTKPTHGHLLSPSPRER